MEIARSVQVNLEAQMAQYEALLNFASTKAALLSVPSNKESISKMNDLVQKEVKVVSVLAELEDERKELVGESPMEKVISEAGSLAEPLRALKVQIKDLALRLREINQKNHLVLQVSLKVIGKVLNTVRDLGCGNGMTYSRIRKKPQSSTLRTLDFKA